MPDHTPSSVRRRRARRRAAALTRLVAVRARLRLLELVRPTAADALALRLWCTPPRPRAVADDDDGLGAGELVRLDLDRSGDAVAEVWGEGPNVYLLHGWGGHRGQMAAFVAPLVAAGHRVVAVDAPGHGDAGQSFLGPGLSTVVEFFDAVEAAVARFGPPTAVVAHSMGTAVAAHMVVHRGLRPARLVLVAPAPPFEGTLDDLTRVLRLRPRSVAHIRARVREILGLPLASLDLVRLAADGGLDDASAVTRAPADGSPTQAPGLPTLPPTLVVHDRGDREAPYAIAERVAATWPEARLVTTEGLGHNRILRDPAIVEAAVEHVMGRIAVG